MYDNFNEDLRQYVLKRAKELKTYYDSAPTQTQNTPNYIRHYAATRWMELRSMVTSFKGLNLELPINIAEYMIPKESNGFKEFCKNCGHNTHVETDSRCTTEDCYCINGFPYRMKNSDGHYKYFCMPCSIPTIAKFRMTACNGKEMPKHFNYCERHMMNLMNRYPKGATFEIEVWESTP